MLTLKVLDSAVAPSDQRVTPMLLDELTDPSPRAEISKRRRKFFQPRREGTIKQPSTQTRHLKTSQMNPWTKLILTVPAAVKTTSALARSNPHLGVPDTSTNLPMSRTSNLA